MMPKVTGYGRTSTLDQEAGLGAQVRDLKAARCDEIVTEQASSVGDRPVFLAALASLQAGDTLVVTKLDRFARSNVDFWRIVAQINAKGAFLRILNLGGDAIDTKSATGRLILTVFAGFAQFEREIMLERQKEGIAKARKEGKYKGRKPSASLKNDEIRAMLRDGMSASAVAREFGIGRASVYRARETRLIDA